MCKKSSVFITCLDNNIWEFKNKFLKSICKLNLSNSTKGSALGFFHIRWNLLEDTSFKICIRGRVMVFACVFSKHPKLDLLAYINMKCQQKVESEPLESKASSLHYLQSRQQVITV